MRRQRTSEDAPANIRISQASRREFQSDGPAMGEIKTSMLERHGICLAAGRTGLGWLAEARWKGVKRTHRSVTD